MPRWLTVILIVLLLCVVTGVVGGRILFRRVQSELAEPVEASIAEMVEASVLQTIQSQGPATGALRITQYDLDINTQTGPAGESGFEITATSGEDDVVIYGSVTTIDQSGIAVWLADMEFHATPSVEDGRIELETFNVNKGATGWILTPESIVNGLETGINNAFATVDRAPMDVTLGLGLMTFTTEPVS